MIEDKDIKCFTPLKSVSKDEYNEMFPDLSEAITLMDDAPVNIEMAYLPKDIEE